MQGTSAFLAVTFLPTIANHSMLDLYRGSVRISLNPSTLHSHPYTVLTHLFTHESSEHLALNWSAIVASSLSLNLGFFHSLALFYGSGIAGLATLILSQNSLQKTPSIIPQEIKQFVSTIRSAIPFQITDAIPAEIGNLFTKTYSICGASAASFGFIGADFYSLSTEICKIVLSKGKIKKRGQREAKLAGLILKFVFVTDIIINQVYHFRNPEAEDIKGYMGWFTKTSKVGYSAHLGGFAFGFIYMLALDIFA